MFFKKLNPYIAALGLLVVGVGFTACDGKDEPEYTGADNVTGQRVYFASATVTENILEGYTTFSVPVYRPEEQAESEATIQLSVTAADGVLVTEGVAGGLFSVPTSVTFAAGATETSFEVTCDMDAMAPNEVYPVVIAVEGADANEYGIATMTLNITHPVWSEWAPFVIGEKTEERDGSATYTFSGYYSGYDDSVIVYSRTNPIDTKQMEFEFRWLVNSDDPSLGYETFLTAHTNDGGTTLIVDTQEFAYNSQYDAMVYAVNADGGSIDPVSGLMSIGVEYMIPDLGTFGATVEYCQLNGYVDTNSYELSIADLGALALGGVDYSVLSFNFTEHVSKVEYTVIAGELAEEDIEAVAEAIADPEDATYAVETISSVGNQALSFARSGQYTIVAVGYKLETTGEYTAKVSSSLVFDYVTNNPDADWKVVNANAIFTESLFEFAGLTATTFGAVLQEHLDYPGYYRLRSPYENWPYLPYLVGSVDLMDEFAAIYIDATVADQVIVEPSLTGLSIVGSPIWIASTALMFSQEDCPAVLYGSLSNKTITLNATGDESLPMFLMCSDGESWNEANDFSIMVDFNESAPAAAPTAKRSANFSATAAAPAYNKSVKIAPRSAKFKAIPAQQGAKKNSRGLYVRSM